MADSNWVTHQKNRGERLCSDLSCDDLDGDALSRALQHLDNLVDGHALKSSMQHSVQASA